MILADSAETKILERSGFFDNFDEKQGNQCQNRSVSVKNGQFWTKNTWFLKFSKKKSFL